MRICSRRTARCMLGALLVAMGATGAGAEEPPFDDQLFRRCVSWMLTGEGGALIENLCIADYAMPAPSLFQCARKTHSGFDSDAEREGCATIFDEQAKRARGARVR